MLRLQSVHIAIHLFSYQDSNHSFIPVKYDLSLKLKRYYLTQIFIRFILFTQKLFYYI